MSKISQWSLNILHSFKHIPVTVFSFLFYGIIVLSFIIRLTNLNYNSAFNDEAIYIVIGRMGLFTQDWWSYGAKLWMAGVPYIYPPLTALAYEMGGLTGARFLNVLFGILLIEEVVRFIKLLHVFSDTDNNRAALIAMFFVAFSGIGIFVSKLATYDMLSFLLLMLGINSFLKASRFVSGKYYFLSYLFIFGAFLTKIVVGIFIPGLLLLSLIMIKRTSKNHQILAFKYMYAPFILSTIFYIYSYGSNFLTYVATHKNLGKAQSYRPILQELWDEVHILWILAIPASVLLLIEHKKFLVLTLLGLASAVPIFHLILLRYATLDKHTYLIVIFLSILAGMGMNTLLFHTLKPVRLIATFLLPSILFLYVFLSLQQLAVREADWSNANAMTTYIQHSIHPGDKVLTEEGGVVVLALYDKIFPPTSIVTFDWIDYAGIQDQRGYLQAIDDRYFDFVELDTNDDGNGLFKDEILQKMTDHYRLAYTHEAYRIYEKKK